MTFRYHEDDIAPILYTDVLRFFTQVKRSTQCPTCPNSGSWNFHVDVAGPRDEDGSPYMMFFRVPATLPSDPTANRSLLMIALECVNCGHLEFLQAAHIVRYLQSSKESDPQ